MSSHADPGRFALPAGIRWLEHTADAGFTVRAATAREVYGKAVAALRYLLLEDQPVREPERRSVSVGGVDHAGRLVSLLEEVIFLLEVERFLPGHAEAGEERPGEDGGLRVELCGESFDPARHRLVREVKAITYHGLRFEQGAGGMWEAAVVVDL